MSGGPTVDKYLMDMVDPMTLQVKVRDWVLGRPGVNLFTLPQLTGSTDFLWLAYGAGLYQLDPATGKIISTTNVSGILTSASHYPSGKLLHGPGAVVGGNTVWFIDQGPQLACADAETGSIITSVSGVALPFAVVADARGSYVALPMRSISFRRMLVRLSGQLRERSPVLRPVQIAE